MKKILILILLILLFSSVNACLAQEKDTLKILLVGNSYTQGNNLPQIVSIISDNAKTKLVTKRSTIGGSYVRQHWRGERGLKTKEMIKNGHFDIVVLQGFKLGTIDEPDSVLHFAKLFCDYIKANGAKPYFYLTWARKKVPQLQETINKAYSKAAIENDAVIIPAGPGWELARKWRPNIELYSPDGHHPSILGTFLTASIFVGTILEEMPQKMERIYMTKDVEGEPVRLMTIPKYDVIFCKKIAEEIMKESLCH